ncbi:MAG: FAD-binding oxidoreductase [Myxococcota bacterium]
MELEEALRRVLPDARVSAAAPDRRAYARDLWPRGLIEMQAGLPEREGPALVVWPESVAHVAALVAFARARGVALVPFGAGSGVCGGAVPSRESIVVDLKRFTSFTLREGPELDVGAGAMGITLEERLLEEGFTTGHYPSSILCSTVGGWVAARGAGQCSGRYGKVEDMVTHLEVVLGTGEVVDARSHTHGAELLPLLVGSEGTLGIITRVGLRLHPAPRSRAFAAYSFPSVEAGIETLRALFQAGLRPAVARLYDPLDSALLAPDEQPRVAAPPRELGWKSAALRALLRHPSLAARGIAAAESSLLSRVTLILMHEGDEAQVALEAKHGDSICLERRGTPLGEGPARAWFRHRYHVSYRQMPQFRAGLFIDTMEVSARWRDLTAVYHSVKRALSEHVLVMAHLSHSYPDGGSIYFTFAGTAHAGDSSLDVYDHVWRVALAAAIDSGASLSHHHGIGRSKAPRLGEELGRALTLQRALKSAWDPDGILNPGVLLPNRDPAEFPPPSVPSEPRLDSVSALVSLPGSWQVGAAETWLRARGHSLHIDRAEWNTISELSVDAWIAQGLLGIPDRFEDPVGSRLAGFSATLNDGRHFDIKAAPRRAVGPDLSALFVGTRGKFGRIDSAELAALPLDTKRAATTPFQRSPAQEVDASEQRAWQRLQSALGLHTDS